MWDRTFALTDRRLSLHVVDVGRDLSREAIAAWEALPPKQHREVDRLAKHGALHEGPAVREISLRWAHALVDTQRARSSSGRLLRVMASQGGDALVSDLRLAQRILEIEAERSSEPPEVLG